MKVKIALINKCSPELYDQFYDTNNGINGIMQGALDVEKYHKKSRALAFYVEQNNNLMGWLLFFKRSTYSKYSRQRSCNIFVKEEYRRQGLAEKLMIAVKQYSKQARLMPIYYPSSERNTAFFDRMTKNNVITAINKKDAWNYKDVKEHYSRVCWWDSEREAF